MKKRSGLKKLFICIIFTGVLAAVIVFSPLFLMSDFQVNTLVHYTPENIRKESGLEPGENALRFIGGSIEHLLAFRMGKAEAQVESLPWVKSAEIRYQIPGTVHITVTERNAIAWIRYMSDYLLIDEEGYVLEVSSALDGNYPEIRGVRLNRYTLGKKIETEKPEKLDWLVVLLKSLELVDSGPYQKIGEVLDWVDFLQDKELFLSLDERITARVKLDDELTYRLSYLKELYYNYIKPEEKGMIDFFDEKYARFIAE
jgi:cell division protein FtsQ